MVTTGWDVCIYLNNNVGMHYVSDTEACFLYTIRLKCLSLSLYHSVKSENRLECGCITWIKESTNKASRIQNFSTSFF